MMRRLYYIKNSIKTFCQVYGLCERYQASTIVCYNRLAVCWQTAGCPFPVLKLGLQTDTGQAEHCDQWMISAAAHPVPVNPYQAQVVTMLTYTSLYKFCAYRSAIMGQDVHYKMT